MELLLLFVLCAISFGSTIIYSLSGFGNAILFHLGWQICSLANEKICSDSVSLVVTYISFGSIIVFPLQMWLRRKYINWALGLHLMLTQQLGLYVGLYILFGFDSVWLARILGTLFFAVALQNTLGEAGKSANELICLNRQMSLQGNQSSSNSTTDSVAAELNYIPYQVNSLQRVALVWIIGVSSGVFGGLFATGGPPLMWFVASSQLDSNETRATVAFLYTCENVGRILYIIFFQSRYRVFTWHFLEMSIATNMATIISLLIGKYLADKISQATFRRLVLFCLAVGSVFILTTGCSLQVAIGITVIAAVVYALTAFIAFRMYKASMNRNLLVSADKIGEVSSSIIHFDQESQGGGASTLENENHVTGTPMVNSKPKSIYKMTSFGLRVTNRFAGNGSQSYAKVVGEDEKGDDSKTDDDDISLLLVDRTSKFNLSMPSLARNMMYTKASVQDDEDEQIVLF